MKDYCTERFSWYEEEQGETSEFGFVLYISLIQSMKASQDESQEEASPIKEKWQNRLGQVNHLVLLVFKARLGKLYGAV